MTDEEIVIDLISNMTDEDKLTWDFDSKTLILGHMTIGMYIRNKYKLWYNKDNRHPDDRSMDIMVLIWKQLNPSKTYMGYF